MRRLRASLLAVIPGFTLLMAATSAAAQIKVDLELVMAVDVSGSVDMIEADLQRAGYVQAWRDPVILRAIRSNEQQRIAVAYVEWSGADHQQLVIDWVLVHDEVSARAFADRLAEAPLARGRWTSISAAIDSAVPMFAANRFDGERLVIDVSGDGTNNSGRPVEAARDAAIAAGVVVNGLPILNDRPQPFDMPTPMEVKLDQYYQNTVIGGPGAFVVAALGFEEFRTAVLTKLVREIASNDTGTRLAQR